MKHVLTPLLPRNSTLFLTQEQEISWFGTKALVHPIHDRMGVRIIP